MLKSASGRQMFGDVTQRRRYFYTLLMILLMVGVAEVLVEREIIFPEMAALTIGMWIVDKRVWQVSRGRMVVLMGLGAVMGVCVARYSPFPLIVNLAMAFAFAALCLSLFRVTLVPLISACMLPCCWERKVGYTRLPCWLCLLLLPWGNGEWREGEFGRGWFIRQYLQIGKVP